MRTIPFVREEGSNVTVDEPLTALETSRLEKIEQGNRQRTQRVWVSALQPWFAQIIARGASEGFTRRRTLVATVKGSSDTFVSRYDQMLEKFEDMVWGICSEEIRPPILVFLFDETNRGPLCGVISKRGLEAHRDAQEYLDWLSWERCPQL